MLYDVIVIGGGPAGLAAAIEANNSGAKSILILERDYELGGILNQCIHNGFGLHYFKQELTGPEYAKKFIDMIKNTNIKVMLNTMVIEITKDKKVYATNSIDGYMILEAKSIILTMGCRERTRGAIVIPGDRPAGIMTAGTAQRYVNIEGYMVGKKVIIVGSGDIGLIMARRMSLEGAKVLACIELMPYSNGLNRNIVQCLNDYNIPLYLSHTIINIKGNKRVEQVTVSKVDEKFNSVKGSEITFNCDTVLLSVGLIPENELSINAGIEIDKRTNGPIVYENRETSIPGIFASGNVVHVHDLVDFVTEESKIAGRNSGAYIKDSSLNLKKDEFIDILNGNIVTYTVPQKIRPYNIDKDVQIFFRVNKIYKNSVINVISDNNIILSFKREHITPGEMEKITLDKNFFDTIKSKNIIISVEEEKK